VNTLHTKRNSKEITIYEREITPAKMKEKKDKRGTMMRAAK